MAYLFEEEPVKCRALPAIVYEVAPDGVFRGRREGGTYIRIEW